MLLKRIVWVALLALFSVTAQARLLVLVSQDSPPYVSFQQGLKAELGRTGQAQELIYALASDSRPGTEPGSGDVIIAAGVEAAKKVAEIKTGDAWVIYTMLPLSSYRWLAENGMLVQQHQVLFIDQPAYRFVNLAKAALPEIKSLGYLHGEVSAEHIAALEAAARENQLILNSVALTPKQRLTRTLEHLAYDNDAILVLPDPYLFNRRTMQSLLLASLRRQTPLIAYSESYVKAGAMLGLFSSPEELGRQTAEMVACLLEDCPAKSRHERFPKYFSVRVNDVIARQLGLKLPSEGALAKQLDSGANND